MQSLQLYAFGLSAPEEPRTASASKTTWKLNPSYEYATNHRVYAVWSQGFRRRGSNAIPLVGPFADNPALITYRPDSADNYEVGLKGHFANGLSYTFAAFKIIWDDPQIGGTTPTTNFAVWNAEEAESEGIELDLNAPLGVPGLSIARLCRCRLLEGLPDQLDLRRHHRFQGPAAARRPQGERSRHAQL